MKIPSLAHRGQGTVVPSFGVLISLRYKRIRGQVLALHSHGSYSLSNLSEKEFNSALALLAELKKCVDIMKKQIGGM